MLERQICCYRHWEYSNEKDSLCFCSMELTFGWGWGGGGRRGGAGWERQKPGRLLLQCLKLKSTLLTFELCSPGHEQGKQEMGKADRIAGAKVLARQTCHVWAARG